MLLLFLNINSVGTIKTLLIIGQSIGNTDPDGGVQQENVPHGHPGDISLRGFIFSESSVQHCQSCESMRHLQTFDCRVQVDIFP